MNQRKGKLEHAASPQPIPSPAPALKAYEVLQPTLNRPLRVGPNTWLYWVDEKGKTLHPSVCAATLNDHANSSNGPLHQFSYEMLPVFDRFVTEVIQSYWSIRDWDRVGYPAIAFQPDNKLCPMSIDDLPFLKAQAAKIALLKETLGQEALDAIEAGGAGVERHKSRCIKWMVSGKS